MAVVSELKAGPRCLLVRITGVVDPAWVRDDAETMFRAHLGECERLGLTGLLYDGRALELRVGTLDLYDVGKSLASVASAGIRIAALAVPAQVAQVGFFEQVATNRGVALKMFTQEREALDWLGCG